MNNKKLIENKQLLIDIFNSRAVNVKYQWCKVEEDDKGITYTILSDTEQTGFIGITVIEWK